MVPVPGTSGPDANAALRLAANDGVMHADEEEEWMLDEDEELVVLPLMPLVLVVVACDWLLAMI
jgi:hypothetical protein